MFGISWIAYVFLLLGLAAIAFALFTSPREHSAGDRPADEIADPLPRVRSDASVRAIEGLGALEGEWCGPTLVSAYFEEEEPRAREAVLSALREGRFAGCEAVLEDALRSRHASHRLLAVEAADAVDARAVLEGALADSEAAVACAAAYALRSRLNGSLRAHLERFVTSDRAAELLNTIRVLT